jgi:assimilatory nitrate reductase catalytic subunit
MAEVGRRMGFAEAFDYISPADIFAEHAALSDFENGGSRDFDIGAYAEIRQPAYEALNSFQWPQPFGTAKKETRFFAEGGFFHPDRKARFIAIEAPATDRTDAAYPFTLNTGRIRDQWHTMTRTGKSARLSSHIAEPFAEIHPRDAMELGVANAALVKVESAYGRAIIRALVTDRQARGSVFVPMHWSDQNSAGGRIGAVVTPATDPVSGQPASKNVAVAVSRYRAAYYGFAVSMEKPDVRDADYWALAKADGGWRVELAFHDGSEDWTAWCRKSFGIADHIEPLGYADQQSGDRRLAFFDGEKLLAAVPCK